MRRSEDSPCRLAPDAERSDDVVEPGIRQVGPGNAGQALRIDMFVRR